MKRIIVVLLATMFVADFTPATAGITFRGQIQVSAGVGLHQRVIRRYHRTYRPGYYAPRHNNYRMPPVVINTSVNITGVNNLGFDVNVIANSARTEFEPVLVKKNNVVDIYVGQSTDFPPTNARRGNMEIRVTLILQRLDGNGNAIAVSKPRDVKVSAVGKTAINFADFRWPRVR